MGKMIDEGELVKVLEERATNEAKSSGGTECRTLITQPCMPIMRTLNATLTDTAPSIVSALQKPYSIIWCRWRGRCTRNKQKR